MLLDGGDDGGYGGHADLGTIASVPATPSLPLWFPAPPVPTRSFPNQCTVSDLRWLSRHG